MRALINVYLYASTLAAMLMILLPDLNFGDVLNLKSKAREGEYIFFLRKPRGFRV